MVLQANDRVGTRLLQQAHSEAKDRNLVVAPLSLTILLGAIQTHIECEESRKEFDQVFGWGEYPDIRIQSRMMLAVIGDKPRQTPRWRGITAFSDAPSATSRRGNVDDQPTGVNSWANKVAQYGGPSVLAN